MYGGGYDDGWSLEKSATLPGQDRRNKSSSITNAEDPSFFFWSAPAPNF